MLNQTGVVKESYGNIKTILVDELNSTSFSCVVSDAGVTAGTDGSKIIKAGTPIYGSLEDRDTAFTVSGEVGATPVGLILHDVDVTGLQTGETRNSQVLVFGFVDLKKLDTDVQAMITASVKSALRMIQFVK